MSIPFESQDHGPIHEVVKNPTFYYQALVALLPFALGALYMARNKVVSIYNEFVGKNTEVNTDQNEQGE